MIDFQAIILAAGRGSRFSTLTKKIPKCLLPIGKTTIIDRQINILKNNGIDDIAIVTGYKSNLLKEHFSKKNIQIIYNEKFESLDSLSSIWCAKNFIKNDFICLYGDLIFNEKLLSSFLQKNISNSLIIDENWKNFENHSVLIENDLIKNIDFDVQNISPSGQFIGICKFSESVIPLLQNILELYPSKNHLEGEFILLIKSLLKANVEIYPFYVNENIWININDENKFEQAKNKFEKFL